MIDTTAVQQLSQKIARQFQPERIILFGSYAYGQPTDASDVDLLVVMRHSGRAAQEAVQILNTVCPEFGVDLLVRSPEEVERRLALNDSFMREVVTRGKVIYDAAHR